MAMLCTCNDQVKQSNSNEQFSRKDFSVERAVFIFCGSGRTCRSKSNAKFLMS